MTYFLENTTVSELIPLLDEVQTTQAFVLRREDVTDDGSAPPDFLYDLLTEFSAQCFVLREPEQARIAGFVTLFPGKEIDIWDIGPLYIKPAYQGQGLGKRLLEETIHWAKTQKVRMLYIQTWGNNARARHVFEHAGFVFGTEIPDSRVDGDSTVTYRLQLGNNPCCT